MLLMKMNQPEYTPFPLFRKSTDRIRYWKRLANAYIFRSGSSNLSFWHTEPVFNEKNDPDELKNYYMDYTSKTDFPGPFDDDGVPMLNYFGKIGVQYNPDAIGQYALGHFERYLNTGDPAHRDIFFRQVDWFAGNLKEREKGIGVWEYDFDWEYFRKLKGPWYTSLGQGHGISVLTRAHSLTGKTEYLDIAEKAFRSFQHTIDVDGGVKSIDENGCLWLEEAIVTPNTHILNGFIWALWGVYDYWLATKKTEALELFNEGVNTLEKNLHRYDNGFWSTYDLAGTRFPGIASRYYHSLHIVQLKIMYRLTGREFFGQYAGKWTDYRKSKLNRYLATAWKAAFKIMYY